MAGARADGVSYVSGLRNVELGVIDLAPGDGIIAGYTYQFEKSDYSVRIAGPGSSEQQISDSDSGLGPVSHTLGAGASNATSTAAGGPGEISVQGTTLANLWRGGTRASGSQSFVFTLTARSALTISADAFLDVATIGTPSRWQESDSSAGVHLWSDAVGTRGGWSQRILGSSWEEHFLIAYANPTDHDIVVNVDFNVSGSSFITPEVPEPSSYAMLGLGLLTVGAAMRRRAKRG